MRINWYKTQRATCQAFRYFPLATGIGECGHFIAMQQRLHHVDNVASRADVVFNSIRSSAADGENAATFPDRTAAGNGVSCIN